MSDISVKCVRITRKTGESLRRRTEMADVAEGWAVEGDASTRMEERQSEM